MPFNIIKGKCDLHWKCEYITLGNGFATFRTLLLDLYGSIEAIPAHYVETYGDTGVLNRVITNTTMIQGIFFHSVQHFREMVFVKFGLAFLTAALTMFYEGLHVSVNVFDL